jgi:hypothetical protein
MLPSSAHGTALALPPVMNSRSIEERVETLEHQVGTLMSLPGTVGSLHSEFYAFRVEMREFKAEMGEFRTEMREFQQVVASNFTRLHEADENLRLLMLTLHEQVMARLDALTR